jgi:hypothetical protein
VAPLSQMFQDHILVQLQQSDRLAMVEKYYELDDAGACVVCCGVLCGIVVCVCL